LSEEGETTMTSATLIRLPDLHLSQNIPIGGPGLQGKTYFLYPDLVAGVEGWVPTRNPEQWKTDPTAIGHNEYVVKVFTPSYSLGNPEEISVEIKSSVLRHLITFLEAK